MATRQTQYAESLGASTTTSTTPQDKTTLTWTPDASATYYAFYSARAGNSSGTTNRTQLRFRDDTAGTNFCTPERAAYNTSDRYPFFGFIEYVASGSPVSTNFKIQYNNNTGSNTQNIQDARIALFKADANDEYASSDSESTTTSTSFQTKTTLTFTPPTSGNYLIIACAEIQMNNTLYGVNCKLDYSSTAYGGIIFKPQNASDYISWGTMVRLNLAASSQTFTIQYNASNASGTAKIRNARILAIRLDAFNAEYYAEARSRTTGAVNTYNDKATLTQTPAAVEHLLFATQVIDSNNTLGAPISSNFLEGSTTILDCTANLASGANYAQPFFAVYRKTLAASSTTWKTQYKGNSTFFAVGVAEAAIAVLQSGTSDINLNIPAGSLTLNKFVPTVATGKSVSIPAGSLTLAGQTPALSKAILVPAASLTLTGNVPNLQIITPAPLGSLTLTGQLPSVAGGKTLDIPAGSLTLAAQTPARDIAAPVPAGTLVLTGYAPEIPENNIVLNIPAAPLTLSPFVPTLATGVSRDIPVAAFSLTGLTPAVDIAVLTPTGGLTLNAHTPNLQLIALIPAGGLTLSGSAPSLLIYADIPAGALTLNANLPIVATGTSVSVPVAAFSLAAHAPDLQIITPVPAGTLVLTGYAPTVISTIYVDVPAAALVLAASTPSISIGASVLVPAGTLTLAGLIPSSTFATALNIPALALVLTGVKPYRYWQHPPKMPLPVYDWIFDAPAGSTTKTITDRMGRVNLTISDKAVLQNVNTVRFPEPYNNGYCWTGRSLVLNKDDNTQKVYFESEAALELLQQNSFTIIVSLAPIPEERCAVSAIAYHDNAFYSEFDGIAPAIPTDIQATNFMFMDASTGGHGLKMLLSDGLSVQEVGYDSFAPDYTGPASTLAFVSRYELIDYAISTGRRVEQAVYGAYLVGGFDGPIASTILGQVNNADMIVPQHTDAFRLYSGDVRNGGVTEYKRITIYNRVLTAQELYEAFRIHDIGAEVTKSPGEVEPIARLADWTFNEGSGNAIDAVNSVTITPAGAASYSGTSLDMGAGGSFYTPNGTFHALQNFTLAVWVTPTTGSQTVLAMGDGTSFDYDKWSWSLVVNGSSVSASVSFFISNGVDDSAGLSLDLPRDIDLTAMPLLIILKSLERASDLVYSSEAGVYLTGLQKNYFEMAATFDGKTWFTTSASTTPELLINATFELRNRQTGNTVGSKYHRLMLFEGLLPAHDYDVIWAMGTESPYPTGDVQEASADVLAESQVTALLNLEQSLGTRNDTLLAEGRLRQKVLTHVEAIYKPVGIKSYKANQGVTVRRSQENAKMIASKQDFPLISRVPGGFL